MKKALLLTLVGLALLLPASQSLAATITFTLTGTTSGSIGGNAFSARALTLTAVAETTNVFLSAPGLYKVDNDIVTIDITGVGSYTFVTPTRTFFNDSNNIAGVQLTSNSSDIFDGPASAALDGWQLTSSIGPVSGSNYIGGTVSTSGGNLSLSFTTSSPGTFRAVVSSPVASVPDGGSTAALLGLALGGMVVARRRLAVA